MTDPRADLVERFIAAVNDDDSGRRRAVLAEICTPDCAYTDPDADLHGPAELAEAFDKLRGQTPPGLGFSLAAPPDVHHEQARFLWRFGAPDAAPVASGSDVAVFRGARIARVYAFFDR